MHHLVFKYSFDFPCLLNYTLAVIQNYAFP